LESAATINDLLEGAAKWERRRVALSIFKGMG
jgi:hypothetical protein